MSLLLYVTPASLVAGIAGGVYHAYKNGHRSRRTQRSRIKVHRNA